MIDVKKLLTKDFVKGFIEGVEITIEDSLLEKDFCQMLFDIKVGQKVEKYLNHFYGDFISISHSYLDSNLAYEGNRVYYQLHITLK